MIELSTSGRHAIRALAAALTLSLAACGSGNSDAASSAPTGEPIAAIPAPEGARWSDTVTVTPEGGYAMGNPEAPLKLVEYGSLTCSHCAHFAEESAGPLREKYVDSGIVSYEMRNQIHDGLDLTMALMVRCGTPESMPALSEQVWLNLNDIIQKVQSNEAAMQAAMKLEDQTKRYMAIANAAGLSEFFAARGVSQDQLSQCLADPSKAETLVNQSTTQSEQLGVDGTPTFFLNGTRLDGRTWKEVEPALQNAGAR
ncbi:MAG: thioredoxin domain-containing protein [Novosphingobium sp.]